jgi:hypothetical protein
MRFAVAEISGQTKAMPAAGESRGSRFGLDLPNLVSI